MHAKIIQLFFALIIIFSLLYVNRNRGCKWEKKPIFTGEHIKK
jgi:hypothetical protein